MKQLIKNILRNLPPFKQLLGRLTNLENKLSNKIIKNQREIFTLKRQLEIKEHEIEQLQAEIISIRQQIERNSRNGRTQMENIRKEMNYLYFKGLHPDSYKTALIDWYYQRTFKYLDLENPVTFNEKIQWLKLYDSTPLKTRLADKYLVREWVAEKIGKQYLIPLYGAYDKFDDIDFNVLPNKFVIKTNHGSGWNVIVRDKEKFDIEKNRVILING